ncbi:MAG: pPIWI-associating nuclease domain-containing protein [Methanothrix sp.]
MAKRVGDKSKESVEIKDVTLKELSRFFNGPIRIRTGRFGLLRFQMITIGDFDFFQELINHNPPAREFVIQIIHHQLFSPKLSVDTIRNWKEKLIIRVSSIWVKNNPELAEYLTESELSIELIKRIITDYMKKQLKYISNQNKISVKMMNSAHSYAESLAFESAQRINEMIGASAAFGSAQKINEMIGASAAFGSAQKINEMIGASAAFGSAQKINEMIGASAAFGSAQRINEMIGASAAFGSAQRINEMIGASDAFGSAQRISEMIGASAAFGSAQRISEMIGASDAFGSAQRISEMIGASDAFGSAQRISDMLGASDAFGSAQRISDMLGHNPALESVQMFEEIWAKQIGTIDLQLATISQIPLKEIALSQALNSDVANLGKSFMDYFSLHSEFQQNYKQNKNGLPPIASELAARELFTATTLVKSIFVGEELNEYDETEIIKEKISIETNDKLHLLLLKLDPELVNLWLGAKEAISSDNPDNARHFNVSLRELFTHVLHKLAPDKEIKSWSANPDDFKDGRPTRDARLRYIYREINDDSFGTLIKKFNSFSLELMDFLNRCTHKPRINMGDMQFRVIMMQIELLISQLIEVSQSNNTLTKLEKTNPQSFSPPDLPATGIGKED